MDGPEENQSELVKSKLVSISLDMFSGGVTVSGCLAALVDGSGFESEAGDQPLALPDEAVDAGSFFASAAQEEVLGFSEPGVPFTYSGSVSGSPFVLEPPDDVGPDFVPLSAPVFCVEPVPAGVEDSAGLSQVGVVAFLPGVVSPPELPAPVRTVVSPGADFGVF